MSKNGNNYIPSPTAGVIAWAIQNPQAVQQAIDLLNRLQCLRVDITTPGGQNRWPLTPVDSPDGMTLALPLKLPIAYAAPTGTLSRATFDQSSVTTAQLAQRVAALITDLQTVGLVGTA